VLMEKLWTAKIVADDQGFLAVFPDELAHTLGGSPAMKLNMRSWINSLLKYHSKVIQVVLLSSQNATSMLFELTS
jgi:hypothetical protein